MPIAVKCTCGHSVSVPDNLAGKRVKCPKCQNPLPIPASGAATAGAKAVASSTSAPSNSAAKPGTGAFAVKCACGKSIAAKVEWGGKSVKCPGCGEPLKIPIIGGKSAPATKSSATPQAPAVDRAIAASNKPAKRSSSPESGSIVAGLLDEVGVEASRTGARCPGCRADIKPDAVLCIECGYHLGKGKQLETVMPTQRMQKKLLGVHTESKAGAKRGGSDESKSCPANVTSAIGALRNLAFLQIFAAVLLTLYVAYTAITASQQSSGPSAAGMIGFVGGFAAVVWAFCGAFAGLYFLAAHLVKKRSHAGWIFALVISGLSLLSFPIGTILGLLALQKLMNGETREWCR